MDPLHPITPGAAAPPSRRGPAVERLRRISRDGDRPEREARRRREESEPGEHEPGEEPGEGHIDIRV